ncbi:ergothioneine biosynthesis glutamate--cysteine ligase EgtA [Rhodococcus aerolatus]
MTTLSERPATLSGRTAAEAHVGLVCFKLGPPALVGAELEWLVAPSAPGPDRRPSLDELAAALGDHSPRSIAATSPALPLPGGSVVTVEPGGQVELSSSPFPGSRDLVEALDDDTAVLARLLGARGLRLLDTAADTRRPPARLLTLPRYCAMEESFDRVGPYGRLMMTSTAAVQVSVDAGRDVAEVGRRWALLHEAAPALLATFARSPELVGAPPGRWASQRMRTWLELDSARTTAPPLDEADPAGSYARWALDVPLLCVRRDGGSWTAPPGATFLDWVEGRLDDELGRRPDTADLGYHLSTLFPPVRASGYLEVRYLDAQAGRDWHVPLLELEALLSGDAATAAARELAAPTAHRLADAARLGLADPELRATAVALLTLATDHTPDAPSRDVLRAATARVAAGRPPGLEMTP